MIFDKFYDIIKDIVLLNYFSGILKQKHITKVVNSVNFYWSNNFLHMVMETLTIALYIYIINCQKIDFFSNID